MAAIRSKDEPRRAWPTKLKGENERAIADFSKALDLDPRLAKAHYNRAAVYRTKSEIDPAIADYSKAIEIDPQYSNAYFSRDSVEAIGDDKIRVNSSSLDHPLTILRNQTIEIVAIEKKLIVSRQLRSA
jgi:tetratricopeptide (TPR) repeat protein